MIGDVYDCDVQVKGKPFPAKIRYARKYAYIDLDSISDLGIRIALSMRASGLERCEYRGKSCLRIDKNELTDDGKGGDILKVS